MGDHELKCKSNVTDFKSSLGCNVAVSSGGKRAFAGISAWAFPVLKTTDWRSQTLIKGQDLGWDKCKMFFPNYHYGNYGKGQNTHP